MSIKHQCSLVSVRLHVGLLSTASVFFRRCPGLSVRIIVKSWGRLFQMTAWNAKKRKRERTRQAAIYYINRKLMTIVYRFDVFWSGLKLSSLVSGSYLSVFSHFGVFLSSDSTVIRGLAAIIVRPMQTSVSKWFFCYLESKRCEPLASAGFTADFGFSCTRGGSFGGVVRTGAAGLHFLGWDTSIKIK